MAKTDVNLDDLQATAAAKADDLREVATETVEAVRTAKLSTKQTVVVVVAVALVTTLVVRKVVRNRAEKEGDTVVVVVPPESDI